MPSPFGPTAQAGSIDFEIVYVFSAPITSQLIIVFVYRPLVVFGQVYPEKMPFFATDGNIPLWLLYRCTGSLSLVANGALDFCTYIVSVVDPMDTGSGRLFFL